MKIAGPGSIIAALVDTVSRNGVFLLNLSPKADGTIPPEQQDTLLGVGQWLEVNGEAIYGTHNWVTFGSGRGESGPNVRFTVKGDALYAIVLGEWPAKREVAIASLAALQPLAGKFMHVYLLGDSVGAPLEFVQDSSTGLKVKLPATAPGKYAYTLKITGVKTNPSTNTPDGNPPAD